MSMLAKCLGRDGAPVTLEVDGRKYELCLIDQEMKTVWAAWLFDRACKSVKAARAILSNEEFKERLDDLNENYLKGEYDFESPLAIDMLRTRPGVLKLVALVFGCSDADAVNLYRKAPAEVQQKLKLVQELSMPEGWKPVGEGDADPNALTPGSGFALLRRGSGRS